MPTIAREPLPGLDAKVAFLSARSSYLERPSWVEAHETHMSWVFLTDRHAFKLKKPVKTPFLDFSTLERRRHFCEEEVRLNRILAPDIYIGVVPLGIDRAGGLRLGGGEPVDYLVQMVRLPAAVTLEAAILSHKVVEADIRNLASRLTAFYRDAPTIGIGAEAYRQRVAADVSADAEALLRAPHGLPTDVIDGLARALRGFVLDCGDVLETRAREGRIVDAHGDLRPEHIYFLPDRIAVIDRLEFHPVFRELDPADELAYLAMECDRAGETSVGTWLFETYGAQTGDRPDTGLVKFYKCARAMLRAKLAIWHLDSPQPRTPERWPRQARAYLDLARAYAAGL